MTQFKVGRFVLGFGVAIAGGAAPAYVVEISHPAHRGTQAGLYNVCWYLGSIGMLCPCVCACVRACVRAICHMAMYSQPNPP